MDDLTIVMFILTFMIGFVFLILGFFDLKSALSKKDMPPALGFVYFLISMVVWFAMAMWWSAMATDAALASLGWLWFGFAWACVALAIACAVLIFKASAGKSGGKLEIREERTEGY
jgi:hypothetical protein